MMSKELQKLLAAALRVSRHIEVTDAETPDGDYRWQRVEFDWRGTTYVYETINGNGGDFLHDMLMLKMFARDIARQYPDLLLPEIHDVDEVSP